MRYQKKNNCKSPNFTALKSMIYIFYKKNNNKVFKFLPKKSHNKYQKSRLTFEKSCEKTLMKKKQSLDIKKKPEAVNNLKALKEKTRLSRNCAFTFTYLL